MAKWIVGKGLDDYIALLGNLEFKSEAVCGLAIYDGAKIVADAIHSEIAALPTSPNKSNRHGKRNPTQVEKDGMLAGLGIAKKQISGSFINVKIGMDGYNGDVTEQYPNGKPNVMVARSIESGTTFMKKNPFISRAVNRTKAQAEEAMKARFESVTENMMNK